MLAPKVWPELEHVLSQWYAMANNVLDFTMTHRLVLGATEGALSIINEIRYLCGIKTELNYFRMFSIYWFCIWDGCWSLKENSAVIWRWFLNPAVASHFIHQSYLAEDNFIHKIRNDLQSIIVNNHTEPSRSDEAIPNRNVLVSKDQQWIIETFRGTQFCNKRCKVSI